MRKFILCRPQNGLNDMLNQIEICCRYAEAHGRSVIVDTAYRHASTFKDEFAKYFVSRQEFLQLRNPFSDSELNGFDVFPRCVKGRLDSYLARWGSLAWTDATTGEPLNFDTAKDYNETVLLHHQGTGGELGVDCLARLRLAPWLLSALKRRISVLGRPFPAMHIRHTDMTSDYQSAIAYVERLNLPLLFLATDNRKVLEDFKAALPATRVVSFSTLPDLGGKPLHVHMPPQAARVRNGDAILDLMTLALAKPLLIMKAKHNLDIRHSGYSRLAAALSKQPAVLRGLLSEPRPAKNVGQENGA